MLVFLSKGDRMDLFLQILYTVLILGFLIFIHELGHFTVAKLSKIKVNEFSLGMALLLILMVVITFKDIFFPIY